jgi:hypothetical protein
LKGSLGSNLIQKCKFHVWPTANSIRFSGAIFFENSSFLEKEQRPLNEIQRALSGKIFVGLAGFEPIT